MALDGMLYFFSRSSNDGVLTVEISPRDAEGRAYFFHVLYWTLRKVRHQQLPHVKRILALYSACQICLNLRAWKRP